MTTKLAILLAIAALSACATKYDYGNTTVVRGVAGGVIFEKVAK